VTDDDRAPRLTMGEYWADLVCPDCARTVPVFVSLSTVLTVTHDDGATLKLRGKSKPALHMCGGDPSVIPLFDIDAPLRET